MLKNNESVELTLNPLHIAKIIDEAVFAAQEIVALHFSALSIDEIAQPISLLGESISFRINGPQITREERKNLHENWILAKAFQDLLRAVRHALEEAHVLIALASNEHRISSGATIAEFLMPFQRKAASAKFPQLLEAINRKLGQKFEFSNAYASLQDARNCLEHRGGVVSKVETRGQEEFTMNIPRPKVFYLRDNEEIELKIGEKIDPGDDRATVETFFKIEMRMRRFPLGSRLAFTLSDFHEISFACHLMGQRLAGKLTEIFAQDLRGPHP